MGLLQKLNTCKTLDALEEFCHELDQNDIQFNGRAYVNIKTHETIDFNDIEVKILEVYKNIKRPLSGEPTQMYKDFTALVFHLKKVTEHHAQSEKDLETLKKSKLKANLHNVIFSLRQNKKEMQQILANYNSLANKVNDDISGGVTLESLGGRLPQDLETLEFLDQFLGFEWDNNYSTGKATLPILESLEAIEAPPPSSGDPKDCISLGALLALIKNRKVENKPFSQKELIAIQDKLGELYVKISDSAPYVKSEIALQVIAILYQLKGFNPDFKETKAIRDHFNDCKNLIRNDPRFYKIIKDRYNYLADSFNKNLEVGIRGYTYGTSDYEWKKDEINFLNQILEFPLTEEHFNWTIFFPYILDEKNPEHIIKAEKNYNFFALVLNNEREAVLLQEKINTLSNELTRRSAATLSPEIVSVKEKELALLKIQQTQISTPLNSQITTSLKEETKKLADFLKIKLPPSDKNNFINYPIIGIEVSAQAAKADWKDHSKEQLLSVYNWLAKQVNDRDLLNLKKIELLKLQNELRTEDLEILLSDGFNRFEELQNKIEILKKELASLKRLTSSNRHRLWRLSSLLLLVDAYDLIKLTDDQKTGKAPLPLIA